MQCFSVCATPPNPQANAVALPANLAAQYLVGASIAYSCNGDLIPPNAIVNNCEDTGADLGQWQIATTAGLPDCSKCITN